MHNHLNLIYTQILSEHDIEPGYHDFGIAFKRSDGVASVDFLIDGEVVATSREIGIPLDKQGVGFTGIYPSLGEGERLDGRITKLAVALGLFSLLDEFPFQHEGAPDKAVSVPIENRAFGQGVEVRFKNVTISIAK